MHGALAKHGQPEIFKSDQGSQFTGEAFADVLTTHGVAISMGGNGAWRDHIFFERLWRSIKHEEVYLHAHDSVSQAKAGLAWYIDFTTPPGRRRGQVCNDVRPAALYFSKPVWYSDNRDHLCVR